MQEKEFVLVPLQGLVLDLVRELVPLQELAQELIDFHDALSMLACRRFSINN